MNNINNNSDGDSNIVLQQYRNILLEQLSNAVIEKKNHGEKEY